MSAQPLYATDNCSACGGEQRVLLRLAGGLVKKYCEACQKESNLTLDQIPISTCPECANPRSAIQLNQGRGRGNYAYRCTACNLTLELKELVPHVNEVYPGKV
jgi:rRNA maturation endonuclease Nob1